MIEKKKKKYQSEQEFIQAIQNEVKDGDWWIYAVFTDELILPEKWNPQTDSIKITDTLLETRIFGEKAEYKIFRGDIGRKFRCQKREDGEEEDFFDETQYFESTPANTIKIRNYISYYEETGQAYVSDWRLVSVKEG